MNISLPAKAPIAFPDARKDCRFLIAVFLMGGYRYGK
jgi:hypothetical protein